MTTSRPVQYFSEEYLEQCAKMTPEQIVRFLDDYRLLMLSPQRADDEGKRKAISLRVPERVLRAFKQKAAQQGVPYQRVIQRLMAEWVRDDDDRAQ